MHRSACSFKHNALIALGRYCAFPTPARRSWTYPASRLLHGEVLRAPLCSVSGWTPRHSSHSPKP